MFYVYILLLGNKQLYTGFTNNLKRRIAEHGRGGVKFTSKRLPVKLIHYEVYAVKE
ncbi:MAG: GIY-YIG nuclease family protein, partial [Candidatus Moranbacteria bacterium]|nr:GIY-YIG nuclease family protein [Candidatus Moranbacteria bacterium]